jgi:hypothetical protein
MISNEFTLCSSVSPCLCGEVGLSIHHRASLLLQVQADNKTKLEIEQVGKGGLPPLALPSSSLVVAVG